MSVLIQEFTGTELVPVERLKWHTFSDGCPHLNIEDPGWFNGREFVVTVRSGDPSQLVTAELAIDLLYSSNGRVVRFLPYLPGARQDKGAPWTAVIAGALDTDAALTVFADAHSSKMPANFNHKWREISPVDLVPEHLVTGDVGIIAPDAGARERAKAVADKWGLPLFQGSKVRDPENNFRIKSLECEPVTTERALVVDDICDGGGTFLGLADAIGFPRERLSLWTTHGIYSKGIGIIRERFGHVACTDSFNGDRNRADTIVRLEPFLIDILKEEK